MCKTNENIKEELLKKLKGTKSKVLKKAIQEKINKLGDSDTIMK